jgi:hypothetical protein
MRLAITLVVIVYLISLIGQPVVSLPINGISIPSIIAARDSSRASDFVVRSPAGHLVHLEKRQLGAIFSWILRGIQVCFEYLPAS